MTVIPPYKSLVDMFERTIEEHGPRDLFFEKKCGTWVATTYEDFASEVERVRAGLLGLGVRRGDRVAIIANNCVPWAAMAHACFGIGAALVPMYEAQDAEEWRFIIRECEAVVLVVATYEIVCRANATSSVVPSVRHVVVIDGCGGESDSRAVRYCALLDPAGRGAAPEASPGETATILYTSGTTGTPKGVVLSHSNIASNVSSLHQEFKVLVSDRTLSFLPWAHALGQTGELHGVFSFGASIAICEGVDKLVGNLVETQPTILFSVPRVFHRLHATVQERLAARPWAVRRMVRRAVRLKSQHREGRRLTWHERALVSLVDRIVFSKVRASLGGRLRWAIAGGAALSRDVAEFIDALGIVVYEGYGLTEASPVISVNSESARKIGSVGRPLTGVRVEVQTETVGWPGEDASRTRREGELIVYGPNVMCGYYRRPRETEIALTSDGGLRTGDLGYIDEDGFVHVTGRIKEQYKLENGKYVVPTPLEERLKLSRFVTNAMVYGANRPHNVALVVADVSAVRRWASERRLSLPSDVDSLLRDPRVRLLFKEQIDASQATIRPFEAIREFELLASDFTIENGMLTPSQKLKRGNVLDAYEDVLERLYAVSPSGKRGSSRPASST